MRQEQYFSDLERSKSMWLKIFQSLIIRTPRKLFIKRYKACTVTEGKGSTWVKTKCDTATLIVGESDVSLDKNCRKWRQNLIKIVESKIDMKVL